jgi:hypothetical protein
VLGHFNKQRTEPTQADKAKSLMAKSWAGITTKIEEEDPPSSKALRRASEDEED